MNDHDRQPDPLSDERFVEHLAGQPFRQPPVGWRGEMLAAAQRSAAHSPRPHPASNSWWGAWLLRIPLVPAGLAAVLLTVWLGAHSDRWLNGTVAGLTPTISAERIAEAQAQRALLWQLAGLDEPRRVSRPTPPSNLNPPPVLRPRSDRRVRERAWFAHVPQTSWSAVPPVFNRPVHLTRRITPAATAGQKA